MVYVKYVLWKTCKTGHPGIEDVFLLIKTMLLHYMTRYDLQV